MTICLCPSPKNFQKKCLVKLVFFGNLKQMPSILVLSYLRLRKENGFFLRVQGFTHCRIFKEKLSFQTEFHCDKNSICAALQHLHSQWFNKNNNNVEFHARGQGVSKKIQCQILSSPLKSSLLCQESKLAVCWVLISCLRNTNDFQNLKRKNILNF